MTNLCRRCGHKWVTLPGLAPVMCPFCKSSHWNVGILSTRAKKYLGEAIISYKKKIGWYGGDGHGNQGV